MSGMSGMSGMMSGDHLNDVVFDAFLANERTLADPQVVRAAAGHSIRLRIINGTSSTGSISARCLAPSSPWTGMM
jgi:hypothetical protein